MKGLIIGLLVGAALMWSTGENFDERSVKTGCAVMAVFFSGATGFCLQNVIRTGKALVRLIDDK